MEVSNVLATTTLLDWLREQRGLKGTKEGCNEGDCGACTVMVQGADEPARALNACILFLPQLDGKSVRTVEGVAGPGGQLHPVQEAMVRHHGSQCGFCTPGFVVSMACAHANGDTDFDNRLAGNLCRCTGYAPIIRAAEAAAEEPVPEWMSADVAPPAVGAPGMPQSGDALAEMLVAQPDAVLVAGATDVGLWVTKGLRDLDQVIFLNGCADLKGIQSSAEGLYIGAMTDMNTVWSAITPHYPSYAEMIRRYGSVQVRNAATIGGNIANGSPIGDNPPALIALGAQLHLRKGDARRVLPIEAFFLEYGKQDLAPGEFVEGVSIPSQPDHLQCYKLSKRFDQDISAVCGCFNITVVDGQVTAARIAFGGMAGIPKRATHVEDLLIGRPWNPQTVALAQEGFEADFSPMDDMRASARYRLETARALLARYFAQSQGQVTSVLEVAP